MGTALLDDFMFYFKLIFNISKQSLANAGVFSFCCACSKKYANIPEFQDKEGSKSNQAIMIKFRLADHLHEFFTLISQIE